MRVIDALQPDPAPLEMATTFRGRSLEPGLSPVFIPASSPDTALVCRRGERGRVLDQCDCLVLSPFKRISLAVIALVLKVGHSPVGLVRT